MFESLKSVLYNNNSGAMVVYSDGIFNKGQDPVYSAQNVGKKIHTVVLGDTSRYKDLSVSKVLYNESVFLGNEFPIEISVSAKTGIPGDAAAAAMLSSSVMTAMQDVTGHLRPLPVALRLMPMVGRPSWL